MEKALCRKHQYDPFVTKAEEISFLENYRYPMIQLDPFSTILVICHTDNTVDKTKIRQDHEKAQHVNKMVVTSYQLHDFVVNPLLQTFYQELPSLLE